MIARTTRALPANMPAPPSLQKNNPTDQSVMFLVLQSTTLPLSMIDEYAQTIAQRISIVSGVAQVNVNGSQKAAVRVEVDPHKLATHGIGLDEVATAITNANVNLPTGTMYGDERNFVVKANGQLLQAVAFGPVIVAYRNGNPGSPERGRARLRRRRERQDRRAGSEGSARSPSPSTSSRARNVVQVVDGVKALLPTLAAQLPAAADARGPGRSLDA